MSLRKKYIEAVTRKRSDFIPFYFGLTPPQVETYRAKYGDNTSYPDKFNFPIRGIGPKYTGEKPENKYREYLNSWKSEKNLRVGIFGEVSVKAEDSHFAHKEAMMGNFTEIEQFASYPYPDPEKDFNWNYFEKKVKNIHEQGLAASGGLACTIFEIGWYLRGMEQMLMDMIMNQELLEFHLDKIKDIRCVQAKLMTASGIDVLHLGDDISTQRGMMMNPDNWRQFFKHRLAEVINTARKENPDLIIKYHTDGNPQQVIPDLIEIGIDILNPIQPECLDPEWVKSEYGDSLTLDGTLGTQSVFPFGTPEDVKKQCLKRIDKCGYNGGLVLAPSHVIEPEVPWENIEAFVSTVKEYNG
ncbi:MAG: uroporphyrinogen decarboxylase family protein [Bacillota bacterium]